RLLRPSSLLYHTSQIVHEKATPFSITQRPLKSLVHVQQTTLGYCLPACVQMALAQLDLAVTQAQAAQVLGTRPGIGTPFSRLERVAQWNVQVRVLQHASADDLIASLTADKAVIVAITTTAGLPGWGNIRTQHTVLLVNVDDR
ncbi:MAG: C39 family peptidase, partial [Anaerolineae bacterium]|nr:C39 family peptidase [Anaerolineae bacterium]